MTGTRLLLDCIEMTLQDDRTGHQLPMYINVFDNSLSRKWLAALNELICNRYHLEKNYCFIGWTTHQRNAEYITQQINLTIQAINSANLGYTINDAWDIDQIDYYIGNGQDDTAPGINPGADAVQDKFNHLHRYFEDLQGVSGQMSPYYTQADEQTRWHIRQLNLLCHEYESLLLSIRKLKYAPEWRRPSQLMCWLRAPRFTLTEEDYELFGIDSINRPQGGVFVGVNKAVGKHHYEVYQDEGRDVTELITTTLRSQTEAAGDFDIEWARDPGSYPWQQTKLAGFRQWLLDNGFDPEDKSLTIGHPQVGQVDLIRTFGTDDYTVIWDQVGKHLNVVGLATSDNVAIYDYNWSDADYINQQITNLR